MAMRQRTEEQRAETRRQENLTGAIGLVVIGVALPLFYAFLITATFANFTMKGNLEIAGLSLVCIVVGVALIRNNRRR